jgi:stage III sporulation protein AG
MLTEWVRKTISGDEGGGGWSKYKPYLLGLGVLLGVGAILWPGGDREPAGPAEAAVLRAEAQDVKQRIERDLQEVLEQVKGAGEVEVRVSLASDGLKTYGVNRKEEKGDTRETDSTGGTRINQEESRSEDIAVSSGQALLIESRYPEIIGVLVVAGGAEDFAVQSALHEAAATLLGVAAHQVEVLPKGGRN